MSLSRMTVSRVVMTLLVAVPTTLSPPDLDAQTNWREVRSIKLGRFRARIDVSSAHTVRLFSQLDTSKIVSVPATLEGHKVEQLVQYPINFKLHAVLPVKPFEVPRRGGRR